MKIKIKLKSNSINYPQLLITSKGGIVLAFPKNPTTAKYRSEEDGNDEVPGAFRVNASCIACKS